MKKYIQVFRLYIALIGFTLICFTGLSQNRTLSDSQKIRVSRAVDDLINRYNQLSNLSEYDKFSETKRRDFLQLFTEDALMWNDLHKGDDKRLLSPAVYVYELKKLFRNGLMVSKLTNLQYDLNQINHGKNDSMIELQCIAKKTIESYRDQMFYQEIQGFRINIVISKDLKTYKISYVGKETETLKHAGFAKKVVVRVKEAATGKIAANAIVSLRIDERDFAVKATNEQGEAVFQGLLNGDWVELKVSARNRQQVEGEYVMRFDDFINRDHEIELRDVKFYRVDVNVVDDKNNKPIQGSRLRVNNRNWDTLVVTNLNGRAELSIKSTDPTLSLAIEKTRKYNGQRKQVNLRQGDNTFILPLEYADHDQSFSLGLSGLYHLETGASYLNQGGVKGLEVMVNNPSIGIHSRLEKQLTHFLGVDVGVFGFLEVHRLQITYHAVAIEDKYSNYTDIDRESFDLYVEAGQITENHAIWNGVIGAGLSFSRLVNSSARLRIQLAGAPLLLVQLSHQASLPGSDNINNSINLSGVYAQYFNTRLLIERYGFGDIAIGKFQMNLPHMNRLNIGAMLSIEAIHEFSPSINIALGLNYKGYLKPFGVVEEDRTDIFADFTMSNDDSFNYRYNGLSIYVQEARIYELGLSIRLIFKLKK